MDLINLIKHNFFLGLLKSFYDLRNEWNRTYLNFIWWIIEPFFYISGFSFLFVVFRGGSVDSIVTFITGLLIWKFIDSSIKTGSSSFMINKNILTNFQNSFSLLTLSSTLNSFYKFLFTVIVFILISQLFLGVNFSLDLGIFFQILAIFFTLLMICWLISASLAYIVILAPDFKILIENLMFFGLFVSGVFFEFNSLPNHLVFLVYLNPFALSIFLLKQLIFFNSLNYEFLQFLSYHVFFFTILFVVANKFLKPKVFLSRFI